MLALHRPALEGSPLAVEAAMVGVVEEGQPGVTLFRVVICLQPLGPLRPLLLLVLIAYLQALALVSLHSRFPLPPSLKQNPSIRPRVLPRKPTDPAWPSS